MISKKGSSAVIFLRGIGMTVTCPNHDGIVLVNDDDYFDEDELVDYAVDVAMKILEKDGYVVTYNTNAMSYRVFKPGYDIVNMTEDGLYSFASKTYARNKNKDKDENIKIDLAGMWAKARSKPADYTGDEAFDDKYRKIYLDDWDKSKADKNNTSSFSPTAKDIADYNKIKAELAGAPFDPAIPYKRVERVRRIVDLNVLVVSYTDGTQERFDLSRTSGAEKVQVGMSRDDVYRALTGATPGTLSQDPLHAHVRPEAYDSSSALDKRFEQPWKIDGLGASVRPADMGDWSVRISDKAAEKLKANSSSQSSVDFAAQDQAIRQGIWSSFAGGRANGKSSAAGQTTTPWGDPLKSQADMSSNTIACMDLPEPRPDYNPNEQVQVYYHDRYPTIPIRSIIDDAIEMLNKNKKLHISKISFSQSHPDFRLAISSDSPNRPGLRRVLEVLINHAAFDRAYKTDIDKYAKLKARLDTNTYMKLRIAFLLYEALKLNDADARKISLAIFKIIGSDTRPDFTL